MHKHLRRLGRIWVDAPIYFVTTCTCNRKPLLARGEVAKVLIDEWRAAYRRHGWAVGRYVIMPDHVHFFCRPERDGKSLSEFVGFLEKLHEPEDQCALAAVNARGYNALATRILRSYSSL